MALQPRPLAVLSYLAAQPGVAVSRDELLAKLWTGTHVTKAVLKVAVRAIREALDDDADAPRYIETVGREGYRFIGNAAVGTPVAPRAGTAPAGVAMVGRESDLARLHAGLAQAVAGTRTIVFVTGEAGIGKTTLLDRFIAEVDLTGNVCVARGQCLEQYGEGEAYLPREEPPARRWRRPRSVVGDRGRRSRDLPAARTRRRPRPGRATRRAPCGGGARPSLPQARAHRRSTDSSHRGPRMVREPRPCGTGNRGGAAPAGRAAGLNRVPFDRRASTVAGGTGTMRREWYQRLVLLSFLITLSGPAWADVDMTGRWTEYAPSLGIVQCSDYVQSGTTLTATPCDGGLPSTGSIDPVTGAFSFVQPPNGCPPYPASELVAVATPDGLSYSGTVTRARDAWNVLRPADLRRTRGARVLRRRLCRSRPRRAMRRWQQPGRRLLLVNLSGHGRW